MDDPSPDVPIASGAYEFRHGFAEHPSISSIALTVEIDGSRVLVTNNDNDEVFPLGLIVDGALLWHRATEQWIIGNDSEDAFATEVGGCSDGPLVIDLEAREFWTC
jgi:hypothetical protein